ncbi:hypothetical protein LOK49_LG13G02863 [Camellia lanceoleosa]|uniref:Uncharacterized protein n=1 Tax=Camellia lanceoleosa TaxID=1840588 RepID=A0ACC0FJN5_9ERIC|nr:hypothetical protein LOK49_LG13G02863 [Camellia lanceoleosa]
MRVEAKYMRVAAAVSAADGENGLWLKFIETREIHAEVKKLKIEDNGVMEKKRRERSIELMMMGNDSTERSVAESNWVMEGLKSG